MREEILAYARMPFALLSYLRAPRPPDPLRDIERLREARTVRFLDTLERAVFQRRDHPYRRMFELAGCTLGDFAGAVTRDGLEAALEHVRRAGVYLTHAEFKRLEPVVRGGVHVPTPPSGFDNSLVRGGLITFSSGSRSKPLRTRQSVELMRHYDAQTDVVCREFELGRYARVELRPILPSLRGIEGCLSGSRLGYPAGRWFPILDARVGNLHYRALTGVVAVVTNAAGGSMPYPEYMAPDDFVRVARCIAEERARGRSSAVTGMMSPCVRIAAAALDHGLDISGTVFFGGGEALTLAKRAVVESAGAEIYPRYHVTELGNIGHACRRMRTGNSVHVYSEAIAVISHRRPAPLSGAEVSSLLFTTLLPWASRLLINVEMDDAGIIEQRASCDCVFGRLGLTTVIDDIASFGKMTGHGVTLTGTEVVSILEERLPARLGGRVGDFQLVEREAGTQTAIELRVSPRVRASADLVRRSFLDELRRESGGAYAAELWGHAQAMTVVMAEPLAGRTGKVLPLHLLRTPAPRDRAS